MKLARGSRPLAIRVFAVVLICMVFGWSGGSKLVKDSYADAKEKAGEMKASRGKGLDTVGEESEA